MEAAARALYEGDSDWIFLVGGGVFEVGKRKRQQQGLKDSSGQAKKRKGGFFLSFLSLTFRAFFASFASFFAAFFASLSASTDAEAEEEEEEAAAATMEARREGIRCGGMRLVVGVAVEEEEEEGTAALIRRIGA